MIKVCDKHGEYEYTSIEYYGRRIESGCPVCVDDMRASHARLEADKKAIEDRSKRVALLTEMNIPKEFFDATFDNFDAYNDNLIYCRDRVKMLVDGKVKSAVLVGNTGVGKTHLACAALNVLGGRYMTMYEISATIRDSYTARGKQSELEIVNNLASVPLLVIDEIGRSKGSDSELSWMSYIIDKRHTSGLPLILISNKHIRQDCKDGGCVDCIENYFGEDVVSRLSANGVVLKFNGKDYRRK